MPLDLTAAMNASPASALIPALARVAQVAQNELQKKVLTTYGLDWNEFQVLRVVEAFPMIRSSQAATKLGLHRATLSGVVARLEARNMLRRLESEDRVRVDLILTPRGSDIWRLVSAAVSEHEREFVRRPTARRALVALSRHIGSITSK
ncbi:MarR family winged helix-turn-helix transcriptional regulator [Dactylosporangium sp. CA-139066]|uniref:MarR family winged helix-turn-helix transcriptional regulator n=1 Tax=Dactylosporangium sp. CA-139066 TaxID=3239930 RepID=UPI003D8AA09E